MHRYAGPGELEGSDAAATRRGTRWPWPPHAPGRESPRAHGRATLGRRIAQTS